MISRAIRQSSAKVYLTTTHPNGKVQRAFAEQIGKPVGACVASKVHTGMGSGEIKNAVRECAKAAKGRKLSYVA
jgi:hypothetical protein